MCYKRDRTREQTAKQKKQYGYGQLFLNWNYESCISPPVIDLAAPPLLRSGVLGAWRVGQLVRPGAAAAAPALSLHPDR